MSNSEAMKVRDAVDAEFELAANKVLHALNLNCGLLNILLEESGVFKASLDVLGVDTFSLEPWDPGLLSNYKLCRINGLFHTQEPCKPMRKIPSLSSEVVYGNFVFQLNNLSLEDSVEEFFIRSEFCPVFALCGSLFPLQKEALSLWLVPWIGCACSGWIWYRDGFDLMYAETCSQPI